MLNLLLGCILLGASGLGFWFALPANGKVRPWLTPAMEPIVTVGFVAAIAVGCILVIAGAVSMLSLGAASAHEFHKSQTQYLVALKRTTDR